MLVLGVDPGSRFVGYGLIEVGLRHRYVGHGVIRAGTKAPLEARLESIFLELTRVIDAYAPEAVAVEGVFTHKNARSALILGHARGVVLLTAARAGIPLFEYAPARVKRSVGSGGNDSKEAVARMIARHLKLNEPFERADATDALAVAWCHAQQASRLVPKRSGTARGSSFSSRLSPNVIRPSASEAT